MQVKRLAINTSSNVSVTILRIAFAFIMTPILVENLLYHDYGIWEVCVSVIGYMGLLDLGLRPAITRHIAMYNSEKKQQEVLRVYSSSFFFMLILGCLSLIIFLVWAFFYPELLSENNENIERYKWLLIIIGCQLFIKFPGIAAESTLDGFHKYYLKNNITIINTIIGNTIIFCYITPENALLLVAGVSTVGITIKYFIFIGLLGKYNELGELPNKQSFSLPTLTYLIRFGSKSFVQGVAWRIEQSITPILIATILNPALVIFYAIPANLVGYLKTLTANLTQALLPYFSENIQQEFDKKQSIYQALTKYVVAITFPIHIGLFLLGELFIAIWLNTDISSNARVLLYFLVSASMLHSLDPLASKFLTAENKHLIYAKLAPLGVTFNVIVTSITLYYWGVEGASVGVFAQALVFAPIYLSYRSRAHNLASSIFLKNVFRPLIIPIISLIGTVIAMKHFVIVDSFLSLLSVTLIGMLVYVAIFFVFGLNSNEKDYIITRLKRQLKKDKTTNL